MKNFFKTIYASVMMIPVFIWVVIGFLWWKHLIRKAEKSDHDIDYSAD